MDNYKLQQIIWSRRRLPLTVGISQVEGSFLGRFLPWKSGPPGARWGCFLAFWENTIGTSWSLCAILHLLCMLSHRLFDCTYYWFPCPKPKGTQVLQNKDQIKREIEIWCAKTLVVLCWRSVVQKCSIPLVGKWTLLICISTDSLKAT